MKKIIFSVLALLMGAGALTGCSSWIEEDPESLITDDMLGDSEDAAKQWVTGVYSKWVNDMFRWGYFPRMLEQDADYISGPDWLFGTFGAGNFQGEPEVPDALWNGCYNLIGRANLAEREIRAMNDISDAVKNNAIGEVKFHKAFAYFLLVRAYGPVPVQPEVDTEDKNEPRQSVDSVYNYIISNLEDAAGMMYKNTDGGYEAGHVNAGSAAGLLAKVYATMASAAMPVGTQVTVRTGPAYNGTDDNKTYAPLVSRTLSKTTVSGYEDMDSHALYTLAAQWAKAVIDGEYGTYELLPYSELWKKTSATASEFMFSVASADGNDTYSTQVHTQYSGYLMASGSDFIASGGWTGCTRHWYDLFEHDDYRITQGVRHRWRVNGHQDGNLGFYYPNTPEYTLMATGLDQDGNQVASPSGIYADGVQYYYNMTSECLAFTTKYDDVTNKATENADANWPFLRYADVLLVYAEAENELGHPDEALTYLNKVRQRSNASDGVLTGNGALDTQEKMRSAIIEERAKEFACEGDRRWDLIRWGIYLDAMNALGGSDDSGINKMRTSRNLLFPIPNAELNTNKSITENNPGWN